tara:strand:+ start:584 stop:733 length:150 start_codon:yes stop_codon:yes gene_type:complete
MKTIKEPEYETLGENSYTQWVNKDLKVWWIPMMNPVYLTENDLWDDPLA